MAQNVKNLKKLYSDANINAKIGFADKSYIRTHTKEFSGWLALLKWRLEIKRLAGTFLRDSFSIVLRWYIGIRSNLNIWPQTEGLSHEKGDKISEKMERKLSVPNYGPQDRKISKISAIHETITLASNYYL